MASVSSQSALKETTALDFDNDSDTDSEGSLSGFIRVSVPSTAAGDSRELDTGNDEGAEDDGEEEGEEEEEEEEEGESGSGSDAWESESFIEDTLYSLGTTTQFEARKSN